jgi:prepilin peptidase CpaA
MTAMIILIGVLEALFVAAAMFDLTCFIIPNAVPSAIVATFVIFLVGVALAGHAMSWTDAALHFSAGFLGLAVGMALFAPGWIGGGDAKLFAAVTLWLGWESLFHYVLLASLLGGALTLGLISFRRLPLPPILADQPWIARLADSTAGVPYGVALAVAALIVLPDTEIFRLAAIA